MSFPERRLRPWLWLVVPLCAAAFLAWNSAAWIGRIDAVKSLPGRAHTPGKADAPSAAGDTRLLRDLILPEGAGRTFDWIEQTELMFSRGEARIRHVDYENVPDGHAVGLASPYRWWLGLVSGIRNTWAGTTLERSVERGALLAGPWLQVILVLAVAVATGRRLGWAAGLAASLGAALLFPLTARFLAGAPGSDGLSAACALASVLGFLAGIRPTQAGGKAPWSHRGLAASAVAGALGLWVSVQAELPILAGIGLGGIVAAFILRAQTRALAPAAWRFWGFVGGGSTLVAYLLEYFPGHLSGVTLRSVHPLYGFAWMGAGELVARAVSRIGGRTGPRGARDHLMLGLALVAALAPLFWMWRSGSWGFLAREEGWPRLAALPNAAEAASAWGWLAKGGATGLAWATLLPLLAIGLAAAFALRSLPDPASRERIAVALGPAVVALAFAFAELAWWGLLDCALVALAAVCAVPGWTIARVPGRWLVAGAVAVCALLGGAQVLASVEPSPSKKLSSAESEQLVDRHLGHWLAMQAGEKGAIVFAPPAETASLCFYGSLRGVGTFSPDNTSGLNATLAIASASTLEEAHDLLQRRGVRYIVLPLWDPFFDSLGKLYLAGAPSTQASLLARQLRSFNLPPWIRPIPYQTPIQGSSGSLEVLVFEVEEGQTPAAAAGRLTEYFVEMGQLELASRAAESLDRFPGDVGALVARTEVQIARGDTAAAGKTLNTIRDRMGAGGDRYLPWDRRVSLTIILAQANQVDACREQAIRCAAQATDARLRSLTAASLLNFQVICHSLGIELPDAHLRGLAVDLLPADLRSRL